MPKKYTEIYVNETDRFLIYPVWTDYSIEWELERQELVNVGWFCSKLVWKTKTERWGDPMSGYWTHEDIETFSSRAKALAKANKVKREYAKFLTYKED